MRQKDRIPVAVGAIAGGKLHVDGRIVNFYDLAVGLDGIGNVYGLLEGADERLGDGGFSVAGSAVDQNRPPGIRRRAETTDNVFGKNQVRHRLLELFDADDLVGDRLLLNLQLIGFQRYGHRSDIFAAAQRLARPFLAGIGERIAHDIVIFLGRAADFHQRILFAEIEQILHDGSGQFDLLG